MTTQELYEAYVKISREFFESVNPTGQEIRQFNDDVLEELMDEILVNPVHPENGGDLGLLAFVVYETRQNMKGRRND
jgi:hypothetical protein